MAARIPRASLPTFDPTSCVVLPSMLYPCRPSFRHAQHALHSVEPPALSTPALVCADRLPGAASWQQLVRPTSAANEPAGSDSTCCMQHIWLAEDAAALCVTARWCCCVRLMIGSRLLGPVCGDNTLESHQSSAVCGR